MTLSEKLRALAEHWGGVDDDRRKLVALAAQAQELERDAERYRWLRNPDNQGCSVAVWHADHELEPATDGVELDAAIDRERGNDANRG